MAAFIAADDEWVDLKGCLGVINSAVEDSNTDLAAVDLMRRFIAKINKQHALVHIIYECGQGDMHYAFADTETACKYAC